MHTLLIADDSEHKVSLLRDLLAIARWPGEILRAATTEDAVRIIDEQTIGFGFIDYYIPSGNGPSVIAHLKKKHPAAHVALVSSSGKQSNLEEALLAGAEACVNTSERADIVERTLLEILEDWKSLANGAEEDKLGA